ncbi:hypothetical protein AAG906_020341 [Vitis piasezkii]
MRQEGASLEELRVKRHAIHPCNYDTCSQQNQSAQVVPPRLVLRLQRSVVQVRCTKEDGQSEQPPSALLRQWVRKYGGCERSLKQMEGLNMYGGENGVPDQPQVQQQQPIYHQSNRPYLVCLYLGPTRAWPPLPCNPKHAHIPFYPLCSHIFTNYFS